MEEEKTEKNEKESEYLEQIQRLQAEFENFRKRSEKEKLENIRNANLSTEMSTYRWSGLYGTVEGVIYLGDSNNDTMINWTAEGRVVFASNASSLTWASLADADEATVNAMYTYLAGATDADNYSTTFTEGAENIGSDLYPALTSDFAYTTNNAYTDTWKTYSLTDGDEIVWAGRVIRDGTSYNGETVDYQMIIPEDGTGGTEVATTYYLWAELQ